MNFIPVQCTEAKFKLMTAMDGHVYFVTDKKKIYLGKNGNMVPMSASSGIYYATKEIAYDNSGTMPDPNVTFSLSDIDPESLKKGIPEEHDLILNIGTEDVPDGCFYRIIDIADDGYETKRLTLQGTGGGGGGNIPGGDGTVTANFGITAINNQDTYYFSLNGTEAKLGVVAHSTDATNFISKIECSFSSDPTNEESKFYVVEGLNIPMEESAEVNLIQHLSKFNTSGSTTIYLHVYDKYDTSRWKRFSVHVVALAISSTDPTMLSSTSDSFSYHIGLSGSTALNKYEVNFDYYNANGDLVFNQVAPIERNQIGSNTICSLDLSSLAHGSYTLKVRFTAKAGADDITSNILTHNMIRFREGGDPILGLLIPEKCEQYMDIPINYLLVYGDSVKEYNLTMTLDNDVITTEKVVSGMLDTYNLIVDYANVYRLKFAIEELSILIDYELEIQPYSGILPVINVNRDDLMVYLTPRGRTNNSADKEKWPGISKTDKSNNRAANLTGFHFRTVDGWLRDNNGVDYLKVAQGASVLFDDFSPLSQNPKVNGLTIELDFMLQGVSNYNTPLIDCISYAANGAINTGFRVTGDKFLYYVGGTAITELNLVQDKRIRISYVVDAQAGLCYTYLDGIVSHVYKIEEGNNFASTADQPANLRILSTAGQINVYGIRYYASAITPQMVVSNYQASLDTLAMREASFASNQIRNLQGIIDLKVLESEDYPLVIPYVKLVGGLAILKDEDTGDMIMAAESDGNKPALPVTKKDYRAINMEVHYPKTPYFAKYNDFSIVSEFGDSGLNVTNAYGETMTKGAWMYGQGTSSMEYPVKNLRVKMKGGKIKVQPNLEAVKLICFKADFMESSGSHNTGAANFIDNIAYKNTGMKTPAQKHFKEDLVTCIKGHPCVIFWSETGEEGTFKFIGKYNLNLDKATPEPFGFKYDDADPKWGYLVNGDGTKYIDLKGTEICAIDDPDAANKRKNGIFCFEFLDNNEAVCNFKHDAESEVELPASGGVPSGFSSLESARYYNSWYNANGRLNEDKKAVKAGWMRGFESRYPEDKEDVPDADALFPLASWINELYALRQTDNDGAVARFKNEYWKYLDEEFVIAYYVLTEALLMADSRVKNMMIATWGNEWRYRLPDGTITTTKPAEGVLETDDSKLPSAGKYNAYYGLIWYPIFYDMDTMLGLDNVGYRNKNYFDEDTVDDVFNGDEILWKFVRDALPTHIAEAYNNFEEKNALRKDYLLPCFNTNQANLANETFYNEDANYKYIDPYLRNMSGSRIFPAQGNRSLDREYFVENRLKYLAGKYVSEDHTEKDRFFFRMTYPKPFEGDDLTEEEQKHNASIASGAVPPSGHFELTAAKTCYGGVKVGTVISKQYKFTDEQKHEIDVAVEDANGTEVYITGISSMASIGDLSDKYPYAIDVKGMKGSSIRSLKLGNHNQHYYNKYLSVEDSIDLSTLAYLEEFNMENCGSFKNGINFKAKDADKDKGVEATPGCSKIKRIILNGCSTNSVTLPVGGVISELRLPTTVQTLRIDSHATLQDENFTLGYFDYNSNKYVNDFSKLTSVYIKNVPDVNSYKILKGSATGNTLNIGEYYLEGFNWTLSDVSDFEITDGNITGIPVLDKLYPKNPIGVMTEMALIGSLTIALTGYGIDEYNLFKKYTNEMYPNLEIKYTDAVKAQTGKFIPSKKLYFYRVDASEAPADITTRDYYYFTATNGSQYLSDIVAAQDFSAPTKMSSNRYDYTFSGIWTDWNTKLDYYQDETHSEAVEERKFSKFKPTSDMRLVPKYIASDRIYKIRFFDFNKTQLFTLDGLYDQSVSELMGDDGKYFYRYRSSDGLGKNQRYAFCGWKSEKDQDNNTTPASPIDLNSMSMTKSLNLYAYYRVEDATKVPSDEDLFEIKDGGIAVKSQFKPLLAGRITVPSSIGGVSVSALGANGFENCTLIEELYFLDSAPYTTIQSYCFAGNASLKSIYGLPNAITDIGEGAFYNCRTLEMNTLPSKLEVLGSRAFWNCYKLAITDSSLPTTLKRLGTQCFLSCENVVITTLGGAKFPNWTTVGFMALSGTGKNAHSINKVVINSPIQLEVNGNDGYQTFKDAFTSNLSTLETYSLFDYIDAPNFAVNLFGRTITNVTGF